jgi:cyclopropane fatty-acyl-phospholipid synthase-like methyltransferase
MALTEPMVGQIWRHEATIRVHAERRRAEATMRLLMCDPTNRILDVGCGVGYQLGFAVLRYRQVVGLDVSLKRLKEGKKEQVTLNLSAQAAKGSIVYASVEVEERARMLHQNKNIVSRIHVQQKNPY